MKRFFAVLFIALVGFNLMGCNPPKEQEAKYVFFFIGDGMGLTHVSITEAYLSYLKGENGSTPISFTKFPVMGYITTFSASNPITCSSAAGTALSTGFKTNNGFLGVAPDSTNLESISYKIHKKGYRVGVMSNVTIDHATPGAFYAHSISRSDYYSIAKELPLTGFEFFGGGGFAQPFGKNNDQPSAYNFVKDNGYVIAAGLDEFNAKKGTAKKMLLLQNSGEKSQALPYSIDRTEKDMKLSDIVTSAISFLDNEKGFFMMAEGGRIDWSAHANDAKTTIYEVIDLAEAVQIAYEFYLKHPKQTLIVVTADHETGGFAMGRGSGYSYNFKELENQKNSKDMDANVNTYEGVTSKSAIDSMNAKANIGWTTSSHTGVSVPVYAIGAGSSYFSGRMDNTDIPKNICKAMGIKF